MKISSRSQLIDRLKQMIQIIEDDDDVLGDFFQDGLLNIEFRRTYTNQSDITSIDQYNFMIASTNHCGFIIEDCNKETTIINDNTSKPEKISEYRHVDLHNRKGN